MALILRYFIEFVQFDRGRLVVEDRPILSLAAEYSRPVIFWPKLTPQQSHGLFATAEIRVNEAIRIPL